MQPVNLWSYFLVGGHVHRLVEMDENSLLQEISIYLRDARSALEFLLFDDSVVPLTSSKLIGLELLEFLETIPKDNLTPSQRLGPQLAKLLREKVMVLERVLMDEWASLPAYFVTRKGIFETAKLVNEAHEIFTEETRKRLTAVAVAEIIAAGRCLAFDLPTSCGFHVLRALEAVVLDYIEKAKGARPRERTWGAYIESLKERGATEDLTSILDQIRRLHRNPLMHPEDTLTLDEAVDLFLLCRSAIRAMVTELESKGLFPPGPQPTRTEQGEKTKQG